MWGFVTGSISRYHVGQVTGHGLSGPKWSKGRRPLASRWLRSSLLTVCIYKFPTCYMELRLDILPFKLEYFIPHFGSPIRKSLSHCPPPKSIAQQEEMYSIFLEVERGVGNDHSGMISVHVHACVLSMCVCVYVSKTRAHPEGS